MVENKTQNQVYKGISSQTLVSIIMGVLEVSVFALMSRLLSQEDFGYYAIIIAVVSVFQCLTEAGLGSAVVQRTNAPREYISTALGLSTILGVIFTTLLLVLAKPLSMLMGYGEELTTSLRWMSITLVLCSVNSVAHAMFMRTLDFMKFGLCRMAAYIVSSTIGIAMAAMGYGVNAIIASAISNAVLTTIILFSVRGEFPHIKVHTCYIKEIVSYGGWLTGSIIVRKITTELDKFILARCIPVAQVGAYNRPSGFISSITTKITDIYEVVLFPILSSFKEDRSKINSSFVKSVSLISWFAAILSACFVLGAQIIIDIFFGPEWNWLITIFRVLSVSVIFLSFTSIGDCYFRSLGLVKNYFYMRSATCVITLLSVFVGAKYGILGVAVGMLISRLFDCSIKLAFLAHKLSINLVTILKSVLTPSWVELSLALICYIIAHNLPYGTYIGVFVFALSSILLFVYAPKVFGEVVYENIYLVAKNKWISLKSRK